MNSSFLFDNIRSCTSCPGHLHCSGPVPGVGSIPAKVMFLGEAPGCFPAGTFVSTPSGVTDIANLVVGDIILDGNGNTQSVLGVFKRQTDQLIELDIRGQLNTRLTPNHPVLVVRAKECYNGHARRFCFLCSESTCKRKYYLEYKEEWVRAGNLRMGDHIVIPNIATSSINNVSIDFPQRNNHLKYRFKEDKWKHFKLDEDLAYVFGWYMAEGCSTPHRVGVRFILGTGDDDNKLINCCRSVFGEYPSCYLSHNRSNVKIISIHSIPLAEWFTDLFGTGSRHKRIPKQMFVSGTDIIKEFINGWYAGDGGHKKSLHSDGIVTASPDAATGLRDLLLRLDIVPTISEIKWRGFGGKGDYIGHGYHVCFPASLQWRKDVTAVKWGDKRLVRVNSAMHIPTDCIVYNIQTGDNMYLVPFTVHNSEEDKTGEPFVGKAGRLLDSLLSNIGLDRSDCYITNVLKCRPPNNAKPTPDQIKACAHWLDIELGMVKPEILVLMGATAIYRILGPGAGTVEHLHGVPIICNSNLLLLPSYHPAVALYETAQLRLVYDDFHVLKGLVAGVDPHDYIISDDFPDPEYVDIPANKLNWLYGIMVATANASKVIAADVETVNSKLWSVQVAVTPGTAYFVGPELIGQFRFPPNARVVFHNYLYDYQFIRVDNFLDTMVMAYQLGLPQGLKELASRLCGMKMQSYDDLVSGAGRGRAISYLTKVAGREWPDPDPVVEFKWDNKAGKLVDKTRKPQHILRKVKRILADCVDNSTVDPYKRWRSIGQQERVVVESEMGTMPASTIADILRTNAVAYSARDADATLRVYNALLPRIRDYGLEFILDVDLSILPMVQEMMDTGFALDVDHLKGLSAEYAVRMASVASRVAKKVGHPFNPGSSPQVAKVVYEELGFTPTKRTGTGLVSTDDRELKKINHPVVKDILEYRRIAKNKDAFADALVERAVRYGDHYRIHTALKVTRTETGRLSSSDPNLQAMPVHHKEGKRIRDGFIATGGNR